MHYGALVELENWGCTVGSLWGTCLWGMHFVGGTHAFSCSDSWLPGDGQRSSGGHGAMPFYDVSA